MALTKVTGDFIKDGVLTQTHLHSSHGITTAHIGEGSNLYFTNARVASYLSSNNYVSGTGTNNRLAIWNGTGVIDSDSDFYVDGDTIFTTNLEASGSLSVSGGGTFTGGITVSSPGSSFYTTFKSANDYVIGLKDSANTTQWWLKAFTNGSFALHEDSVGDKFTIAAGGNATFAGDLTVSGGDITLGGTGRIQGIDTVSAGTDAANKTYVDNQVAGIVDSAPGTLDTLNELAAALGDDANFSTTVSNNIAAKLPLAGGTLTGVLTGVGIKTPYVETTTTNQSLFLRPNGTGHLYIGDSGNGSNIYHYSAANDGVYTSFSYSGNYYQIDTTATSGIKIVDNITAAGNVVINGSGSSGNALNVTRGSDSTTALRVQNAGEVVTQANYFYAAGPGVSMYVQNTAVFRGGIMNDGSNADVRIADNLTVEGAVKGDIYYDRNNTGYYLNPESWSYIYGFSNEVRFAGGTYSDPDPGVSRDAKFGTSGIAAASGKFAGALVGTTATFSGNVTAPSFIGKLMGGANGAPDATIWCVSGSYTDWGIFYDENTPDVIQFKSSGNVKATISLDNGDYTGRNATFTGTISASGYNNSNWDTAYGWGNHASAGYLTSYTETNGFLGDGGNASTHPGTSRLIYSGQVSAGSDVLGMPTLNNANAFINLNKHSGEYNSQLGFSSDGNIYYRNFNNTAINNSATFRKIWDSGNDGSGSGLDADLLDGSHASSFWTKSGTWYGDLGSHSYTREIGLAMTGGSEFVILSKSGQGSVLVDGHYMAYESANGFFGSYNSAYGNLTGIRATAANTLKVMQLDGGNAILEVTQDARAPIFYDSNNTAYYIDPSGGELRFQSTSWTGEFSGKMQYHGNHWYIQSGGYVHFRNSSGVNTFHVNSSGVATVYDYLIANNSLRAPLFYDLNDTGYYTDPSSISRMSSIWFGKGSNDRNGAVSIGLNDGQLLFRTNTDYNHKMWYYDGLNFSTNPSHGHIRFWADGSSRNNSTGGTTIVLDSDCQNIVTKIYGQTQSPIYYDLNNTGYYLDPASTSFISNLTMNGNIEIRRTDPTIYFRDTDHNSAMLHTNSNIFYILRGGNDTTTWTQVNSNWPLTIDLTNNNATFGGNVIAVSDMRAPIFYDQNDTTYYSDPGGTSLTNNHNIKGTINFPSSGGTTHGSGHRPAYGIYQEGDAWSSPFPDLCIAMHTGIKLGANASYNGIRFYNDYTMATQVMAINDSSSPAGAGQVYVNDTFLAGGSVRGPIFYDSNNTTYYTRPSTYSYMNQIWTAGTIQAGSSGTGNIYLGNNGISGSGNHFRFHTNNSHTYFDGNCGDIHWRQGSSTRFYFYMTSANMTINGTLTQNSDERIKENIVEIPNALEKIDAMRGVYYNRTDINTEVKKIGVIAQEVEAVLPEVILEAPDTGLKSVAYAELTAVLVQAIKEQQTIIDDLKSRIETLENQ